MAKTCARFGRDRRYTKKVVCRKRKPQRRPNDLTGASRRRRRRRR